MVCMLLVKEKGGDRQGMIKVKTRGNESIEQLLRRFKKICEKEGLTKDIKRNAYYEKPSDTKRRKLRQSQKREIKNRVRDAKITEKKKKRT